MCHCQDPQGASPARTSSPLEYANGDAEGGHESPLTDGSYQTPPMEQVEVLCIIGNEDTFPRRPLEDCCLAASVPLPESPLVEIDSDVENQAPEENIEAIPVPAPSYVLFPKGLVRDQRAIRGRKGHSRSFRFTHS